MKNKFETLAEEILNQFSKKSYENLNIKINKLILTLENKGVKYEKQETHYTSGAIKYSVCYSFTINGKEFEIEEFEKTNGKKFVTANIDFEPNEEDPSDFAYKSYDQWNMDDFFATVNKEILDPSKNNL